MPLSYSEQIDKARLKGEAEGLEVARMLLRLSYMANGLAWGRSKKCKELLDLFDASLKKKLEEINDSL